MPNLILTADDYGVIDAIDNAILAAAQEGRINSIAALANADDAEERFARLKKECPPEVEIGCHFTLSSGKVLSAPDKVKSLHKNGYFRSYKELKYSMKPSEVNLELKAQLKVFDKAGIRVKHLSSHHKSLDYFRPIHKVYLDLAHSYYNQQIPFRSPYNKPKLKQYIFTIFLAIALEDDMPDSETKKLLDFAGQMTSVRKVNALLKEYGFPRPKVKLPSYFDSTHLGLPDSRLIPLEEVVRMTSNRRRRLLKAFRKIKRKRPVEFLFHLIEDQYEDLKKGKFEEQLKKADYPGINPNYFDGRLIEMRSLMGISQRQLDDLDVKMTSWLKT